MLQQSSFSMGSARRAECSWAAFLTFAEAAPFEKGFLRFFAILLCGLGVRDVRTACVGSSVPPQVQKMLSLSTFRAKPTFFCQEQSGNTTATTWLYLLRGDLH